MAGCPTQSTDLIVPQRPAGDERQLWPEPLDTPGYIPRHMKRSATASFPVLEIVQRLLYRLRSSASGGDLEKVLALIGLYQAVRPAYNHLKELCIWAFTVQVTIPENDPVSREVLAWMGSEVILKRRTRSAMLVTGGLQDPNDDFHRRMMLARGPLTNDRANDEVLCLPPIGTQLFWYVTDVKLNRQTSLSIQLTGKRVGFRPFVFSRRGGQSYRSNSVMHGNLIDERGQLQNSLTLMTLGWSLKPLQAFTELCHQFKLDNLTGTTNVFFAGGAHGDPYGDQW